MQMGQRRSVAAWDDIWRIEMKCAFSGPRQLRVAVFVLFRGVHKRFLAQLRTVIELGNVCGTDTYPRNDDRLRRFYLKPKPNNTTNVTVELTKQYIPYLPETTRRPKVSQCILTILLARMQLPP